MKITFVRTSLLDALKSVAGVIPDRPTHPVLGNFLFTPKNGEVTVRGYDLATSIEWTIDAYCDGGEPFVLPKKITLELISQLSGDEVTIEIEEGEAYAVVRCDSAEVRVQTSGAEEYPGYPELPDDLQKVTFPVEAIARIVSRVSAATAKDESKQILTGVHVSGNGNRLEFATTDGHRLAVDGVESGLEIKGLTFPVEILQDIIKAATKAKAETIDLFVSDSEIHAEFDRCSIYGRMLSGNYPEYRKLLPASFKTSLELDRATFKNAIELVSIVASYTKHSNIVVKWANGSMEISAIAVDSGTARQIIDCPEGSEGEFGFHSKYLLNAIQFHSSETILFNCNEPTTPVTLTSKTDDSIYLVMPVMIVRE